MIKPKTLKAKCVAAKDKLIFMGLMGSMMLFSQPAFAQYGGAVPGFTRIKAFLCTAYNFISNDLAMGTVGISCAIAGIMWAVSEETKFFTKTIAIVFGAVLAFYAMDFVGMIKPGASCSAMSYI